MMHLNNGIWIVFGTLSLFCMSYLGAYQIIESPYLENMKTKLKLEVYKKNHLTKRSQNLRKACQAHSQEESFLRLRIAELKDLNDEMYQQAIGPNQLITFYDNLTARNTQNQVEMTSIKSETIQLKGAAILNLNLNFEGPLSNLLSWLKDLETENYPMVINQYTIHNNDSQETKNKKLDIQLSLLVAD